MGSSAPGWPWRSLAGSPELKRAALGLPVTAGGVPGPRAADSPAQLCSRRSRDRGPLVDGPLPAPRSGAKAPGAETSSSVCAVPLVILLKSPSPASHPARPTVHTSTGPVHVSVKLGALCLWGQQPQDVPPWEHREGGPGTAVAGKGLACTEEPGLAVFDPVEAPGP